jgi:hypothetical protein
VYLLVAVQAPGLEVLCGDFGRFRRGTIQFVNAEFGRKLISDRAARQPTRQDKHTGCLACLVERAVERDASVLISQEIIEDDDAEDPRDSLMDDIDRENAEYESERGFDEFVSEK